MRLEEVAMDKNRVILIVMDSLGVGELPDAGSYGDASSDTFGHIAKTWAMN